MGNVFSIYEDNIHRGSSMLGSVLGMSEDTSKSMSKDFKGMNNSGLFDTSPIENSLNKCQEIIQNNKKGLDNFVDSVCNGEMHLFDEVQKIDIPLDFVKNNSMKYNNINDIKLNNGGSKVINSNNAQEKLKEIDDSTVEEEKLVNILKTETNKAGEIDNSSIEKEQLNNIEQDETKKVEEIKDNSFEKEQLDNIVQDETKKVGETYDNSFEKENLSNSSPTSETQKSNDTVEYSMDKEKLDNIQNNGSFEVSNSDDFKSNFSNSFNSPNSDISDSNVNYNSNDDDKQDDDEEPVNEKSLYDEYLKNREKDNEEEL